MEVGLEENILKSFIYSDIPQITTTYAQQPDAWKKNVAKVRWILLEGVWDHILSSIHGKVTLYAMLCISAPPFKILANSPIRIRLKSL